MTSDGAHETLVECSWQRIASAVQSDSPRDPEAVHASLIELNPRWRDQTLSLVVELCGFAYGQFLDCARGIAAARRRNRPVSDRALDDLDLADDVLSVVRDLFERYEPNPAEIRTSLN